MARSLSAVLTVGLLLAAAPVFAHHNGSAKYDSKKPITFIGKVTKVEWMNPHIYFYVDVTDESGKVTNWAVESGSPSGLYRAGVSKSVMKIGDQVKVSGFLPRVAGVFHVNGRSVTFPDGKKIFVGANDGLPDAGER